MLGHSIEPFLFLLGLLEPFSRFLHDQALGFDEWNEFRI